MFIRSISYIFVSILIPIHLFGQELQPIIDVHLHTNEFALPYGFCALSGLIGTTDVDGSSICEDPLSPAKDKDDLLEKTIDQMQRYNIVAAVVSSRSTDLVKEWKEKAPNKTIMGLQIGELNINERYREQAKSIIKNDEQDQVTKTDTLSSSSPFDIPYLSQLIDKGELHCLGEVSTQYVGIAPNSELLDPLYELAVEKDIPIGIHMAGFGAPRTGYVIEYGNPLLLEEVLVKYPNLRIYVMHMGFPFVDEMAMIMRRYKNVYVDISAVSWMMPRSVYYQHLKKLVDYGLGKRIMFGTDQVWWPDAIGIAVEGIKNAPFLTHEQKSDIFYNNAVRFFQLD